MCKVVALLAFVLMIGGCASGSVLKGAEIDRSILTGSTPAAMPALDPERLSDARVIRNAVSTADPGTEGAVLAWSNEETGSAGAVTAITEASQNGRPCRSFLATRERFDGVVLYRGLACRDAGGDWNLVAFEPV